MEAIFFLWELLKECLQQCLIPESLGIVRKFQWTGGGGGGRIIPFKCQNIKQISTRVSTWERFSKPRNSSEDYWGINSKNGVNQHRLTQIILFNFYETKNLINNSNRLDIIFLDLYNIFGLAEHILTKTSQKKNN